MTVNDLMRNLGFVGMETALRRQQESPQYLEMPFEDRLYQLLQAEETERINRKIKCNITRAKLKDRYARIEDIDYGIPKRLDKSLMLSLVSGDYVRRKQNIIITGATGTGKSYIAQALAYRAICDGFTARYYRMPRLMEDLKLSRLNGTYINTLNQIARFHLLILDDFGISPLGSDDANDLLEVIEDRVRVSSTIITSQLPLDNWYDYLNNETVADAILDRLIHNSYKIDLKGESVRKIKAEKI